MREHNAICDRLATQYPEMSDQELYDKARLVNAALMAKIHTVDWTPAIIAHPTTVTALRANWWGILGEGFDRRVGRPTGVGGVHRLPGTREAPPRGPHPLTRGVVAL